MASAEHRLALIALTMDYDRGEKLDAYKGTASVREVWLVDSERRRVTVWRRREATQWPWHADEYIGGGEFASAACWAAMCRLGRSRPEWSPDRQLAGPCQWLSFVPMFLMERGGACGCRTLSTHPNP